MNFRISGLEPARFAHYFRMTDAELAAHRALRRTVDSRPGFPCRVSLADLAPGEITSIFLSTRPTAPAMRSTSAPALARHSTASARFHRLWRQGSSRSGLSIPRA